MTYFTRTLAAALAMTLFLSLMVGSHLQRRAAGTEILLDMLPRDPRDFFLGHYSQIRTSIDALDTSELAGEDHFAAGSHIYVLVEPNETGSWHPVSLHADRPPTGVFLHGMIDRVRNPPRPANTAEDAAAAGPVQNIVHARFNIERLYASAEQARELDQHVADLRTAEDASGLRLIIAVPDDGNAIIKGVEIDGTRRETRLW
jgi:uncharacterized membrane-anchored protein